MATGMELHRDVEMKTRDGVVLRADVYRPAGAGRFAAILVRTPYDKTGVGVSYGSLNPATVTAHGFALVIQDVRGRFRSEGDYEAVGNREGDDGYDTVEWLAAEPWCNGRVGMHGASYASLVQWMAAMKQPPSLKAIIPEKTGKSSATGALALDGTLIGWSALQALDAIRKNRDAPGSAEAMEIALAAFRRPQQFTQHLPLNDLPFFTLPGLPTFQQIVETMLHSLPTTDASCITVPAMLTSSWYDLGPGEVTALFCELRSHGGSPEARAGAQVVFGPWDHGPPRAALGEWFFGNHADATLAGFDLAARQLNFFARWLRDEDVALPVATYFVMGRNEWQEADDWPPSGTEFVPLYLRSAGGANSANGDGALSWDPPARTEPPDHFAYDPLDPVPSFGGSWLYVGGSQIGPFDQARIESRQDVLVYTTVALDQPVEIAGPVKLKLTASSSAVDTDFVAKLCDVDPSGRSHNIAIGILRCRWRDGFDTFNLLEPDKLYELEVDLRAVAHRFLQGHRIRVQLTSSAFPGWDRNMNTGHELGTDATGIVARQTVFHAPEHFSAVILPLQKIQS